MFDDVQYELWTKIANMIKERISPQQYDTWFGDFSLKSYSPELVEFSVPNNLIREWIEDHYLAVLRDIIREVKNENPRILFVSKQADNKAARANTALAMFDIEPKLNPGNQFDNFIIGPSNRLAHAASIAVAESPAEAYNPLFVHSSVGLGKTHLLQAICIRLLQKQPNAKVAYLPCEDFMNLFINAVQSGILEDFRRRFRDLDILFIDDIHFLAHRERSQEEFFHTFNALYNANKQIVLSSDSHPREIPNLEERIISRFKWGLVVEIEPPSFETRIAILKKKSQMRGYDLPNDVIEFLADKIKTNVRDLEGAVVKMIGYSSLLGKDIDMETAKEVLKHTLNKDMKTVTFEQIIKVITKDFGVSLSDLQSKKRSQSLVMPRQVAMYICRQLTNYSLQEIGGYFGGRDHTTVKHAVEKIERISTNNSTLKSRLDTLNNKIVAEK